MNRRQESAHDRAQIAFSLYYQMGHERSLRRLHLQLRSLGVQISLPTLKRYSVQFNWQGQIADLDAETHQRQRQRHIEDFLAM